MSGRGAWVKSCAIVVIAMAWGSVAWPQPATPTPTPTAGPTPAPDGAVPTPTPAATAAPTPAIVNPCSEPAKSGGAMIDATRRGLYETLCNAAVWFDGLFGRGGSTIAARSANGRIELSGLGSKVAGAKVRTSVDVDVTLPHLQQKLNAFIGRDNPEDYIRDRREGFALRSQFVGLENEQEWLAGIGYAPPSTATQRMSFRVGGSAGRQPQVFAQGLYQRNVVPGASDLWTLREVPFWRSREGFGFTSSADYDHVVSDATLVRWGTVGSVSQGFKGLDWRSAVVLYHRLDEIRAMAYEAFLRGETGTGVDLGEYGARVVYRQSVFRRWLFAEALLGYSWLRQLPVDPRRGSVTLGLGTEMEFGRGY